MDAHRVDILDGTDNDGIVRCVADHFHLVFFPAQQAFIDQDLRHGGGSKTGPANFFILFDIVRNAATGAAEREGRADDGGQANFVQRGHGALQAFDPIILAVFTLRRRDDGGAGIFETEPIHRVAEQLAVFGHLDGFGLCADQLHAMLFEDAGIVEVQRAIECGLATHGREQGIRLFGPAPITRIERISVRFGMLLFSYRPNGCSIAGSRGRGQD